MLAENERQALGTTSASGIGRQIAAGNVEALKIRCLRWNQCLLDVASDLHRGFEFFPPLFFFDVLSL